MSQLKGTYRVLSVTSETWGVFYCIAAEYTSDGKKIESPAKTLVKGDFKSSKAAEKYAKDLNNGH